MEQVTISELIAQRDLLDCEIKNAVRAVKNDAFARAEEIFTEAGITVADLHNRYGARKPTSVSGKERASVRKVPAKYRHKPTGALWSGRGRPPIWYRNSPQDDIEKLGNAA